MITSIASQPPDHLRQDDIKLRKLATKLEATFLAEMLKTAGFGSARESFGGGIGEEQFSSFMIENHAEKLAETGGIGLAEHLFNSLRENENDR